MAKKPDLIEFQEEEAGSPVSVGGIIGGILGAVFGYSYAKSQGYAVTPVPPDGAVTPQRPPPVPGEPVPEDPYMTAGIVAAFAAIGYGIGAYFSKRRRPRRFQLMHRD